MLFACWKWEVNCILHIYFGGNQFLLKEQIILLIKYVYKAQRSSYVKSSLHNGETVDVRWRNLWRCVFIFTPLMVVEIYYGKV